jgi:type II secretory pathway pseudopilin PulG
MKANNSQLDRRRSERGYALLLVIFMTTLMLIGIMAAAPSIRTERQREKEQEMIWRGKQYIRGIKLYYRKMGRFPTSLDNLTKPTNGTSGQIRFMRQAYKDPMNKEDGTWRLIYVGPAGQLIGSLKPQPAMQIPGLNPVAPGAVPAGSNAQQQGSGFGGSSFGTSSFGQSGTQPAGQQQPGSTAAGGTQGAALDDGTLSASATTANTNPIIGGNIIGVGSKINRRSIIIYDKAKNYRLFEFVWNPSKDLMNALGQGGVPTPGVNNAPGQQGQSSFGGSGSGQGGGTNQPPQGGMPPGGQPGPPAPTPPPPPPPQQ